MFFYITCLDPIYSPILAHLTSAPAPPKTKQNLRPKKKGGKKERWKQTWSSVVLFEMYTASCISLSLYYSLYLPLIFYLSVGVLPRKIHIHTGTNTCTHICTHAQALFLASDCAWLTLWYSTPQVGCDITSVHLLYLKQASRYVKEASVSLRILLFIWLIYFTSPPKVPSLLSFHPLHNSLPSPSPLLYFSSERGRAPMTINKPWYITLR